MSRFVYYLIISNMVANIIASVPRILLGKSEGGAILTMIMALFFGVLINWLLIRTFSSFPGKSLPQILDLYVSKWVSLPALFTLGVVWYTAGLQTLISYVDLLLRFLTPEMSVYTIFATFVLVISFGMVMQSRNVLSTLEVVFVMLLPLAIYFLVKIYFNEQLNWDHVKVAVMYIDHPPNYTVFAAASYLFVGAFDIIVFNSLLKKKMVFGFKQAAIVLLLGTFTLITTYFVPIGILGFDKIEDIIYPWILTSDSVRMKFGVIERVIFIFLLIFLAIAFLNIMIHWHVSFKLFKHIFQLDKLQSRKKNIAKSVIIVIFWAAALFITIQVTEYDLFLYSIYFFNIMPVIVIGLIGILLVVKRRAKS
ncbi:GerAB/ArcD/ProY family transporter [Sporosarcina obsidiansis]|uniref:GerAB/ArcD/ProY family transporter n=1 Tax=Sporosarcina obsidiansis TaxID=2660748 RepID=UPI00129B02D3|nr:GerAB/ArcD/ProY family transporter [Sporosarcina obsidiansis]